MAPVNHVYLCTMLRRDIGVGCPSSTAELNCLGWGWGGGRLYVLCREAKAGRSKEARVTQYS